MREWLSKIAVRPKTRCWIWTLCTTQRGYGRLSYRGKHRYIHHVSYEEFVGPILEGKQVCHRCDVPSCCNPDHLYLGSQTENLIDCVRKGRHHKPTMTEAVAREVKYEREMTRQEYAAKYGITVSAIDDIRRGRCWRYV